MCQAARVLRDADANAPADVGAVDVRRARREPRRVDAANRVVLSGTGLVPGDDEVHEDEWEARARPYFDGEIVCGVDLDQFALQR